ncbi:hypothetical protein GJ496_004811 [Pomphorhynchus laevis]|nr:hypothetical protein GJ496_004811 [Pomphorhynchus laevis]
MTSGMPWKVRWHTSVPMGFGLKPFTPSFICIHQKAFMFIRLYLRLQRPDNQGLTTSRCFMLPISYDLTTGCIEISALQCPTSNDDVIAAINFISSNLTEYSKNHARSSGSPAAVLFLTLRDLVCRLPVTFGAGSEELFQMSQSQIFQRSPNLQLMSPTQRIMSPTHRLPTGELVYRQISPQYTTRMEYQAQMGRHPIETNVSRPPQLINRSQGRGRS